MIEKLDPHRFVYEQTHQEVIKVPDNWELMEKMNEIIDHINKMEDK